MKISAIDGNIVDNPAVHGVNDEWTKLEFSVANNDDRKQLPSGEWKTTPSFFTIIYWTKNPTPWIKKIVKGAYFSASLEPIQERWTDKNSGQERSKVVFKVTGMPTIRAPQGVRPEVEEAAPWEE